MCSLRVQRRYQTDDDTLTLAWHAPGEQQKTYKLSRSHTADRLVLRSISRLRGAGAPVVVEETQAGWRGAFVRLRLRISQVRSTCLFSLECWLILRVGLIQPFTSFLTPSFFTSFSVFSTFPRLCLMMSPIPERKREHLRTFLARCGNILTDLICRRGDCDEPRERRYGSGVRDDFVC